jgi:predicted secreted protein
MRIRRTYPWVLVTCEGSKAGRDIDADGYWALHIGHGNLQDLSIRNSGDIQQAASDMAIIWRLHGDDIRQWGMQSLECPLL